MTTTTRCAKCHRDLDPLREDCVPDLFHGLWCQACWRAVRERGEEIEP